MNIHRPTVLILASDPSFSREIIAHWPQDPVAHSNAPEFIVLDDGFASDLQSSHYDLAIADAALVGHNQDTLPRRYRNKRLNRALKQSLRAAGKPTIWIHSDPSRGFYCIHGPMLELRREPGIWPWIAALAAYEMLRRVEAEGRTRTAEKVCAAAEAEATLGRYMIAMRTNVNNILTTVLGNAELLMQESGLPPTAQAQADAIRNMALRLHEVFQRFSSLEKEMNVAARDSETMKAHAGTAGQ